MLAKPGGRVAQLLFAAAAMQAASALDLDTNSTDSIKSVAQTLAGGIVETYKAYLEGEDGIPGLFPEPYYWHEAGGVFNSLINYAHLTGDTQYNELIVEAMTHQLGETNNYMPPNQTKTLGNDDQATWGIGAMTAAELGWEDPVEGVSWLDVAVNVFDSQAARWDAETCGGGLRWQIFPSNAGYTYKETHSNGGFFLLAARLAKETGNKTYTEWADKSFKWAQEIGLVTDEWEVFDGADSRNDCEQKNHLRWTRPHALYLEGAAVMHNLTEGDEVWEPAVRGLTNGFAVFHNESVSPITEAACESNARCNVDQRYFKGPTVRSLHRAILSAPIIEEELGEVLKVSAEGAATVCTGEGEELECDLSWTDVSANGPIPVNDGGIGEANNALEAVVGLLWAERGASADGNGNGENEGGNDGGEDGSPTQSGALPESTGAAGRMGVAAGCVIGAAMVAVAGLA